MTEEEARNAWKPSKGTPRPTALPSIGFSEKHEQPCPHCTRGRFSFTSLAFDGYSLFRCEACLRFFRHIEKDKVPGAACGMLGHVSPPGRDTAKETFTLCDGAEKQGVLEL